MIILEDVLGCERVMNYRGMNIRYTSGITAEDTKVSAYDAFYALKAYGTSKVGYVEDIMDLVTMCEKAGVISKAIKLSFEEVKIYDYLMDAYISIDSVIAIAKQYKIDNFEKFLVKAKKQIAELGCFVDDINFNVNDKKKNNDQNASSALDLQAVEAYANLNGMSFEDAYIGACDVINNIVLGDNTENMRLKLNMFTDGFISEYITQREYDEVVLLSKVMSYLMWYSDISFEGMGIFCHMVLKGMSDSYRGGYTDRTRHYSYDEPMPVIRKNQEIDYNDKYSEYDDEDPFTMPIKKKKDTDVENFKKFM